MGCGIQRSAFPFAPHDKTRRSHRSRNNTKHTFASVSRSFSMNDHFSSFMNFLPCEVVMVLNHFHWCSSQLLCNFIMNDVVTRRSIVACKIHRHPIFDPFFFLECQPCEVGSFPRKFSFFFCDLRVMVG